MTDRPTSDTEAWPDALGRTIKIRRIELGMSRRRLADAALISYSYLSAIENGTKVPSTKTLMVIAECLGFHIHELHAEAEARLASGGFDTTDSDGVDTLIEQQEQRFFARQQARMATRAVTASSIADRRTLFGLVNSLSDDDVATLTRVAEGLMLRRTLPRR